MIVGIIFLAVELQQNTRAIEAQTRDSVTEKQMEYSGWVAMNPDLAEAWRLERPAELQSPSNQGTMFRFLQLAIFREFEDSHYQYERGLFTADEFEARRVLWRVNLSAPGAQRIWASQRETFAPSFRAEIDRIVAEVGG